MKTKLFAILFISVALFLTSCDEESITEAVVGSNSVTLSGDISKTFDVTSIAAMVTDDTLTFFTLMMKPKSSISSEEVLSLSKLSETLPQVGNYSIGENVESGEDFIGFYALNESDFYFMHSGTVKITESSSSKIAGSFNMSGYYFSYPMDSTRVLNVNGKFSTIPTNF